jgi:RND family efflux transporter MFP subunit
MKQIIASHHVIIAGVTAILSMGPLAGCTAPPAAAAAAETAEPIAVSTAQVVLTDVTGAIEAGGVVQARVTATIAGRILAPIRDVRVSPGDHVRVGQTLIVLDGDDLAASARAARAAAVAAEQGANAAAAELQAADAGLALARASHDRIAGLQAKRSATAQELDDATAARRSAEARVAGAAARVLQAASAVESARAASDQASTTHSFTTIAAPFDGLITEKLVEPGNMASPGMPLLRLEDTRGFRLDVRVDESRIDQIRNGDSVPVFLGAATMSLAGAVVEVGRAVDADARSFLVKIALPDERGVRSGAFGRAQFSGTSRRALTVPASTIVRHGQVTSVFVVENGLARVRLVSLRESEVLAGLTESEVVILSPPAGVTEGRRVSVGGR